MRLATTSLSTRPGSAAGGMIGRKRCVAISHNMRKDQAEAGIGRSFPQRREQAPMGRHSREGGNPVSLDQRAQTPKIETMHAKLGRAVAISVLALAATTALAQYPSRPIKIIVSTVAGGAPDIAARVVGQKLSESLGQAVVVDNHAGSNGNIAGDMVAKAQPDGYTLLLGQDSLIAINPHLYAKMPFDPLKDLVPVATVASIICRWKSSSSAPASTCSMCRSRAARRPRRRPSPAIRWRCSPGRRHPRRSRPAGSARSP